jgi:anti-sigma B factor antagonist
MMGDDLWTDPVHGAGGPGLGVQVCSDTSRSWVSLRGDLDLVSAPHLQQVLDQLCRDGYPEIVLDLSELEFLGAAGLTVFHRIDAQLRAVNGRLILHRPPPLARRMLAITRLDTVLTIRPATARSLACDPQRGRRAVRITEARSQ